MTTSFEKIAKEMSLDSETVRRLYFSGIIKCKKYIEEHPSIKDFLEFDSSETTMIREILNSKLDELFKK